MDTRTGIKLGKAFLFRFHRRVNSKGVNGNCVTVVTAEGYSNQLSLADFQGF